MTFTNICIRDMNGISSFHSGTTPYLLGSLAAPSDPGFMATLCAILQLCNAALFSRRHRQPPQTRFAPPKLPQPLVQLVDVASPLARRVGCICLPVWKFAPPMLSELVWDCRSRVVEEKQGHQGHPPQDISGKPHIEDGRG